jgi:hypothetical protein
MLYTYIDERRKRQQFTLINEQTEPLSNPGLSLTAGGVFKRSRNPDEALEMENFDIYGDSSEDETGAATPRSARAGTSFSPVRRVYRDDPSVE